MSSINDPGPLASPAEGSPVKFPMAAFASAASYFDAYAEEMARATKTIDPEAVDRAAASPPRGLYPRGPDVLLW